MEIRNRSLHPKVRCFAVENDGMNGAATSSAERTPAGQTRVRDELPFTPLGGFRHTEEKRRCGVVAIRNTD